MAAATSYTQQAILEHLFRHVAYTSPTTVYLSLGRDPLTVSGAEVTGGSYARQAITFGAFASGKCVSSNSPNFGTATADWGTITHWGIHDASSAGNCLETGPMNPVTTILNGTAFSVPTGAITVRMA